MSRFVFSLQTVLELREREERDEQRAVAQLEQERVAMEGRLRSLQASISTCKTELRDALAAADGAPMDPRQVRLQMNASLHMQAKAQETVLQLAGLHRRLDEARVGLREAARRRRAMEVLRDRQQDAWKDEQRRREEAQLDELAVMRAGRRSIFGGEA